ncbi:hypothetical protein BJ878DRAFT_523983 [Calycina marina]|uniref:Uncharacterized protein n=1 Tax=Calycina marina TaxID=1763456 RepID=A0A9P7YW35_9HELO|nr:hypothetical protein BJ878DRAFT_523983 [Calycina marina]
MIMDDSSQSVMVMQSGCQVLPQHYCWILMVSLLLSLAPVCLTQYVEGIQQESIAILRQYWFPNSFIEATMLTASTAPLSSIHS